MCHAIFDCSLAISNNPAGLCESLDGEDSDAHNVSCSDLSGRQKRTQSSEPLHATFVHPDAVERATESDELTSKMTEALCMVNAACAGAIEVVHMLSRRSPDLWKLQLSQDTGRPSERRGSIMVVHMPEEAHTVLAKAVDFACIHASLDAPVRGIEAMLSGIPSEEYSRPVADEEGIYARVHECNGNVLHVAAARGHTELVKVLLKAGLKPDVRAFDVHGTEPEGIFDHYGGAIFFCANGAVNCSRGGCTPLLYAQNRGHARVASLLADALRQQRPQLLDLSCPHIQVGILCFYHVARDYGFLQPDAGTTERSKGIFVHGSTLRQSTSVVSHDRFPVPGQPFAWRTSSSRRGPKAVQVANYHDGSYIELLATRQEAHERWVDDGPEDFFSESDSESAASSESSV